MLKSKLYEDGQGQALPLQKNLIETTVGAGLVPARSLFSISIKLFLSFLVIALLVSTPTFAQKRKPTKPKANTATETPSATPTPAPSPTPVKPAEPETVRPPETPLAVEEMEKLIAVIETSKGDITLEFYPKIAPNHVRQFVWLARSGYFDGMSVSRVIPKFIIQSGNPGSWEDENPNKKKRFDIPKIKAEYDANVKHTRGTLSMARPTGEPDGGTSHFFICAQKASSLDGQYSAFGQVINGLDIVDQIAAVAIAEGSTDKPAERIEVKHVVIKEKEIQKPAETEPSKQNDPSN